MNQPILYSFRRCPYAMRARLALAATGIAVELREVVLRDKPDEMLAASPKGTVPVLILEDDKVVEESRDIMEWALSNADPDGWFDLSEAQLSQVAKLVDESDGPFKAALDTYKYASRDATIDTTKERAIGADFMMKLNTLLEGQAYLFGDKFSFADGASERFKGIMTKYPQWKTGDEGVEFGR